MKKIEDFTIKLTLSEGEDGMGPDCVVCIGYVITAEGYDNLAGNGETKEEALCDFFSKIKMKLCNA